MRRAELAAIRFAAGVAGALPDHLGQFRLAQWYWWRRRPPHQFVRQRFNDGAEFLLDLGDRTQALAFLTRRYSEDLVRQLDDALPSGGLLFDVGANVGLITFQIARRRPDVRIVAFEANPAAAELWRANHGLNPNAAVTLVQAAVSDRSGNVTIDAPVHDLGGCTVGVDASGDGVRVPAIRLDDYCSQNGIDHVDLIKLDVEGHEPAVLRGAEQLFARAAIPALIMEFNEGYLEPRGESRSDMINWLSARGLQPRGRVDLADVAFELSR